MKTKMYLMAAIESPIPALLNEKRRPRGQRRRGQHRRGQRLRGRLQEEHLPELLHKDKHLNAKLLNEHKRYFLEFFYRDRNFQL